MTAHLAWTAVMGLLTVSGPLLRTGLFNRLVEYRATGSPRLARSFASSSPALTALDRALGAARDSSIGGLALVAAGITADRLCYAPRGAAGPDQAWEMRGVNCHGYAAVYAASLNHLLARVGLADRFRARVVSGRLVVCGRDFRTAEAFPRLFLKHKYVCIGRLADGEFVAHEYVDANLYDYARVLYVRADEGAMPGCRAASQCAPGPQY